MGSVKTVVELAREVSDPDKVDPWRDGFWVLTQEELERFHTLTRNAALEEAAKQIQAMPFGDTAASFAIFLRNMKEPMS